jgi:multisubunit Na+/H+ antiporter MnhC subunit
MSAFNKVIVVMAIGSFAALIVLALIGHFLELHVPARHHETASMVAKVTAVGLFLVLGFSLFPLMLHLFVVMQDKIGNADVGMVRFMREHERGVVFTIWGIFTAGLLIALPVMWTDLFGFAIPLPRTQGVIVVKVGMTLAETAARSTFKIPPGSRESLTGSSMSVSRGVFDFEVADAGTRFERCRYCALETGSHDDPKVVHINVGISTRKMTRDKLVVERESIVRRLQIAGWSGGHYEYANPEDITLHGGTREGDGRYWAKNATLLVLSEKRMDDAQPGEDPQTAGEFIHVIDVLPRNDPSYRALLFEPAHVTAATEKAK